MPALTQKAKRRHFDSEEEGNDSDNEGEGGILAQRAARRLAAQVAHEELQQQAARKEPKNQQAAHEEPRHQQAAHEEPPQQQAARQQPQQQQVRISVFLLVSF